MIIIFGLTFSSIVTADIYEVKIEVPQSVCASDTLWVNCTIANNSTHSIKIVDSFEHGAIYWRSCGFYISLNKNGTDYSPPFCESRPLTPFKLIKIKKYSKYSVKIPLLFNNLSTEFFGEKVDLEPGFYNLEMSVDLFRPKGVVIYSNTPIIELKGIIK